MIDTETLRSKILSLALQGKLTMRFPEDGDAQNLYDEIQQDKKELIKSGIVKKKKN